MLYQSALYLPFLAVSLALYWGFASTPRRRSRFLATASLAFFLALGLERYSLETTLFHLTSLCIAAVVVFYCGAKLRRRPGGPLLYAAMAFALAPLVAYKYLPLSGAADSTLAWVVPLGISYFTFKHIHFLIESSRGNFAAVGLDDYFAYITFFPMFGAGPIERLHNFAPQLASRHWQAGDFALGVERMVIGAIKKFVVADLLLAPFLPPADLPLESFLAQPWPVVVLACVVRFLHTYADFSGYTDMALGTARLFGLRLMENFAYPLLRSNLAEFWRAWHISLSSFVRDYVYFPVLGRWRRPTLALLLTMVLIGLWHAGNPGWALWGLHHGCGLVFVAHFQRLAPRYAVLQAWRAGLPWRLFSTALTWFYVSLGFALTFRPASLESSLAPYGRILAPGFWP